MLTLDHFDYPLPPERIAQTPVEPRSSARLLVGSRDGNGIEHRRVADLPELLGPGDVLVVNETRVLPARLLLEKATGGAVEVLVVDGDGEHRRALVRPSKRVAPNTVLYRDGAAVVEVGGHAADGLRDVRLLAPLEDHGTLPLPPYIHASLDDAERYQTVYARTPGSAAAPTAGLHLTNELLEQCRARGVHVAALDLAVGMATFKPMTAPRVQDHRMHEERYAVPEETLAACRDAARVVAVGTTTVRALESAARGAPSGRTDLFVRAPFEFKVVDALLTNFHLPRSSLLVMLHAFIGDRWRALYEAALAEHYRFLSFGDAMFVHRA